MPTELPLLHAARGLRVVVVEDHPVFREQLCHWLRGCGAVQVVHATDAAESAARWLQAHPGAWDLAVIDVFLARGHGFEVLAACGDRDGAQKAVMLTSYTRDPVRAQALRLGADAVFDKALEFQPFLAYLRECAAQRTAELALGG